MEIYLPIAGVSVNLFLILGLGGLVGFLSGLFGVGGGFLLTPFLILIGIPSPVAVATSANQMIAASTSGALAHYKLGNVDIKMGFFLIAGGILGGAAGVHIVKILRSAGSIDFVIKLCFVIFLTLVGTFMFFESLRLIKGKQLVKNNPGSPWLRACLGNLPLSLSFEVSKIRTCIIPPVMLGVLSGILAGIMGIGGGFILIPAMFYILGMPMMIVIGTSLFQILFTISFVTFMQAATNHTVDILLTLLLLPGSALGAQYGARVGRNIKEESLRIMLSIMVLLVSLIMLYDLVSKPRNLISVAHAEELVFTTTPEEVSIRLRYQGEEVLIYGLVPKDSQIVVKISSPGEEMLVGKKRRVGPFWMDVKSVKISDIPMLCKVYTSFDISQIPVSLQRRLGIDPEFSDIKDKVFNVVKDKELADGLIEQRKEQGLYEVREGEIEIIKDKMFTISMALPAKVPTGNYSVEVFAIKGNKVIGKDKSIVRVDKVGIEKWLTNQAQNHGIFYGLIAVILALIGGMGVGIIFKGIGGGG